MSYSGNLFGAPPKSPPPEEVKLEEAPEKAAEAAAPEPEQSEAAAEPEEAPAEPPGPEPAESSAESGDESPPAAKAPQPEPAEGSEPADPVTADSASAPPEEAEAAPETPTPPEAPAPSAPPARPDGGAGQGRVPPAREAYRVLALQYRPQVFADLVGQQAIARTLQNAIRKERIGHAFLFAGPRGVGKTTTARILAKALNCAATATPNPEPCGGCESCNEIAGGFSRDVPEIDGASNNSVEKAREIIETAHYTPSRDRFKIFLVDEVHMLSGGAFNALLKTLEEPPPHVKFIFATTEIHKIPDTILSRCQEFEFRAVTQDVVADRLRHVVDAEGLAVAPGAIAQLARFGKGSLRDALSALDQVIAAADGEVTEKDVSEVMGLPDVETCRRAAVALVGQDAQQARRAVFEIVGDLVSEGRDLKHFAALLTQYLRDVAVARAAPDRDDLLDWPDEKAHFVELAESYGVEDLLRSLDVLARVEADLRWSPEPRFHLEMALLKLVEMPRLVAFDEQLSKLDERAGAPAPAAAARMAPAPSRETASTPGDAVPSEPTPLTPGPAPPAAAAAPPSAGAKTSEPEPELSPEARAKIQRFEEVLGGRVVEVRSLPDEEPSVGG